MMNMFTFDDSQSAIEIHRPDTPNPWINYLSNGRFHAFVSQAGGGFAWFGSAVTRRLTRYRQYHLPIDSPGFYIYLRERDGSVWCPAFRPCETPLDAWSAFHHPGATRFRACKDGVTAELELFVAPDHNALIWDLQLKNERGGAVELDVFAYSEASQNNWREESSWGYYTRHHLEARWLPESEALITFMRYPDAPILYFAGSHPNAGYDCDRHIFMGNYRSERNPIVVEKGACTNVSLPCGEACLALQSKVRLADGDSERLHFYLGVVRTGSEPYAEAIQELGVTLLALRKEGAVIQQRAKLAAWWEKHLEVFDCDIPDIDARRQINIWSPINSVHTGRYSRSVNTWAPGIRGVGFRDTCQDMLAIAYRDPAWATGSLRFLMSQQYHDGHVVHYCYPEEGDRPTTSIHSDDHLWPPLVAYAIAAETGDLSFLLEDIAYLGEDHVSPAGSASLWEHLLQGIRFTENHLGHHQLPLTLKSDWNDIIGRFNRRGKGQSVFAGQQYVYALNHLIPLARALGDRENMDGLTGCRDRMVEALLAHAWDGRWWRRGFDDDGAAVGSQSSDFGNLFLNPQSWAVLAGIGSQEQQVCGMQSAFEELDTPLGLKILAPGFKTWPDVEDPFSPYCPGTGENAAIFCHANTWAIMAEARLGNAERAWKYFRQLIPAVAQRTAGAERYRAEPYAWVSNIVGPENEKFGWANVEQVTGTAAWMDVAATQSLIGLQPELGGLRIDPCIPADWKGFTAHRIFRGCRVTLTVENPNAVSCGVASLEVNGESLDLKQGPVLSSEQLKQSATLDVRVILGVTQR